MLTTLSEKLDPAHCALLVVDMQHDFCSPGGFVDRIGGDLEPVGRVANRISELLDAARESGAPIFHVRSWFDDSYLNEPMRERLLRFDSPAYCVSGTHGADFIGQLRPAPDEEIITKHRYSAFHGTPLELRLEGLGVRTVVVCGTATNNCVDGTARDAFYRGLYVALPGDASCAPSVPLHEHAMATAAHAYAVTPSVDEIAEMWRATANGAARSKASS